MNLTRKDDWPALLAAEIEAARGRLFSWGTHDCCAFCARCVAAITGRDFMVEFGAYADEFDAAAMIEQCGGVARIARACLGPQIDVTLAQRGDVVMRATSEGNALGICLGEQSAFASSRGLAFHPTAGCNGAWRV